MAPQALEKFLSFAPPLIGEEEIAEVVDTLKSGWLTTGPKTERFEKEMAGFIGSTEALALNSCTAALHLGLNVLEVGPGQGVITSPLTFASTGHVIMHQQARPFFVDVSPDTGNLDPQKVLIFLEKECAYDTDGRLRHKDSGDLIKTIMPVHYGGHPADLDALWDIAAHYKLNMLEDAAHAIGAEYNNLQIGNPGLKPNKAKEQKSLCAFSFYATKNMSTAEGGLLCADDAALLGKARVMGMYGISDSRRIWGRYAPKGTWVYDVAHLGFKYNMTDIQAALGLWQLKKLPKFIEMRAQRAACYNEALKDLEHLVELPTVRPTVKSAWHLYPLRLKNENLKISRDDFIEKMRELNIGSSVLFIPLHYHSFYKDALHYSEGSFPVAENFFKQLINLPLAPAHPLAEIEKAAHTLAALLKSVAK